MFSFVIFIIVSTAARGLFATNNRMFRSNGLEMFLSSIKEVYGRVFRTELFRSSITVDLVFRWSGSAITCTGGVISGELLVRFGSGGAEAPHNFQVQDWGLLNFTLLVLL